MLLILAVFPAHCNESHFGIDDWTSQDFADHLKKDANLNIPATAIEACGITGHSLHLVAEMSVSDLSTGTCSGLGLNPVQTVQLKESLSRVVNRASSNPVDFWEWRAANRRLVDYWIQPLALNPRAFLLWMRFSNISSAGGIGKATAVMFSLIVALFLYLEFEFATCGVTTFCSSESVSRDIVGTNGFTFFVQWLFVPSYPIAQMMTNANDANSWMDEMLRAVSAIGVIVDVAVLITFVVGIVQIILLFNKSQDPNDYYKGFIVLVLYTLLTPIVLPLVALAAYYFLWFAIPSAVVTIGLYLQIYIVMPGILVFLGFLVVISFLEDFHKASEELKQIDRDETARFLEEYRENEKNRRLKRA